MKIYKNLKKIIIIEIIVIVIFVCIFLYINKRALISQIFNKSEIEKESENLESVDISENWDLSKVYVVEDPTGIKVPVPIGYTVSDIENEKYVNGIDIEHKGVARNLNLTTSGEYPWTQNDDGIWQSGNQGILESNSTIETEEFTVDENGGHFKIEWSVSSVGYSRRQPNTLIIYLTNLSTNNRELISEICGTSYGTDYNKLIYITEEKELKAGRYKISVIYRKNDGGNSGLDTGFLKKVELINYKKDGSGDATVIEHVYGGLVIYEGTTRVTEGNSWEQSKIRNQWVWIPVTEPGRLYNESSSTGKKMSKLYQYKLNGKSIHSGVEPRVISLDNEKILSISDMQGITSQELLEELQINFDEMIKSIEKYGGFYIGRYETGNLSTKKPIVQRMNTDISSITWYNAYNSLKNIDTKDNVKTGMIWGCLWDEMIQWLLDTRSKTYPEIANDSSGWGNYYNVNFSYTNTSGGTSDKMAGYSDRLVPTGSTERNKANNIYDLAGNVREWTTELYNAQHVSRGGDYAFLGNSNSYPAASRTVAYSPWNKSNSQGARAYLFIK